MPPRKLTLPDTHALDGAPDVQRFAPSAGRNADPISAVLARLAPPRGQALEIASGTGQHIARWATEHPGLSWQPSDVNPDNLDSIRAWAAQADLPNLRDPILLDAGQPGWGAGQAPLDLIVLVNLLHLIATPEAETVIAEAALALAPDGVLAIYGPFSRDGAFTSDGDAGFHRSLTAQDPAIGYKDTQQVADWMQAAGLVPQAPIEMPANNLFLIARHAFSKPDMT
ncbi:DUF938 domain-containing protein [Actibacterium ureilyticum]|uniref:DUF938 domain-containing protein n=1 Tax=Actibacterium ureilyticum TaxID=1590614 RepID=UPI000BAAA6BF|nr:DUF938 domain-containing protein [Actibacterium ureilyticum]